MLLKISSRLRAVRELSENNRSRFRSDIPAGMAKSASPLGPKLGFVKAFNERTANIKR